MRKTFRISGSVSGVIATGSYANLKPSFTWEETYEIDESDGDNWPDEEMQERRRYLYDMSMILLKEAETKATIERIERERQDLRMVRNPVTGKISPSVTSVINYDMDFFVAPEDLKQYASQGNIIDARVKHYIRTGAWVEAKEISDIWVDILILKKGSLGLSESVGDFPGFLDKYKITDMCLKARIFEENDLFNGEIDFIGIPEFKGAKEIPTVCDVKRTPDKIKHGIQLAAYCMLTGYDQGMIVPLNGKTEQQYSKPIVFDKKQLDGYYKMFLQKRDNFKKRYGV